MQFSSSYYPFNCSIAFLVNRRAIRRLYHSEPRRSDEGEICSSTFCKTLSTSPLSSDWSRVNSRPSISNGVGATPPSASLNSLHRPFSLVSNAATPRQGQSLAERVL